MLGVEQDEMDRGDNGEEDVCKRKLKGLLEEPDVCDSEKCKQMQFLLDYHEAISLEGGDHSETNLIEIDIDPGSATPIEQPIRRITCIKILHVKLMKCRRTSNRAIKVSLGKSSSPCEEV